MNDDRRGGHVFADNARTYYRCFVDGEALVVKVVHDKRRLIKDLLRNFILSKTKKNASVY